MIRRKGKSEMTQDSITRELKKRNKEKIDSITQNDNTERNQLKWWRERGIKMKELDSKDLGRFVI